MSIRRKSRVKPEGLSQLNLNAAGVKGGVKVDHAGGLTS